MKLPKRVPQHISETASFKLFSSNIPDNWIIRDITERDYGIDCYLELVNENNELTGELASIQLKSRKVIPWTIEDYYNISNVDIANSNYWHQFSVPVFIFLADIDNKELYFLSVSSYIRKNYSEFLKQQTFNYKFYKNNEFKGISGINTFKSIYEMEINRSQFENELMFFLSNLKHFEDFQFEHDGRDFHLGVEDEDLVYFEAMHRNYKFLCNYLNIENLIPSIKDLKRISRSKFKGNTHYELYEHDLTEWVGSFQNLTVEIKHKLKNLIREDFSYWLNVNTTLLNYVLNL